MDERYAYWLAALIDGEGSIVIRDQPGRVRKKVCITIAQNDRRLLEQAVEFAGCGTIYGGIGPRGNCHQLQIFRQKEVKRVLQEVGHLLIVKKERAAEALVVIEDLLSPRAPQERGPDGRFRA